jgi:DNA-binding CsgD family transcriptional regulator
LLGRERERAEIEALLHDLRNGRGGALTLVGEPGIGKTALLSFAADGAAGCRVIALATSEAEIDVSYATLSELVIRLHESLDAIPDAQAAVLRALLTPDAAGVLDPIGVYASAASLLSAASAQQPVLVTVDDTHWLDPMSARAIAFLARALELEAIAIIAASRTEARGGAAGARTIALEPLDEDAARRLLARHGGALPREVSEQILRDAAGNPLALREIPRLLTDAQRAGAARLPDPLQAGALVEAAYAARTRELSVGVQTALLLVAAHPDADVPVLLSALATLGVASEALEQAEASGLLELDGRRARLRHPLVRSAVYHAATQRDRRRAHRALSEHVSREQRAWHLAQAALGVDEDAARELEEAAAEARAHLGFVAAMAASERAAEVTADSSLRARRLVVAAHDAQLAGRPERASALLDEAAGSSNDTSLTADIEQLRAQSELAYGRPDAAWSRLARAASLVEQDDPFRAGALLADATLAAQAMGDVAGALETGRRAVALAHRTGQPAPAALLACAQAALLAGHTDEAGALLEQARVTASAAGPQAMVHVLAVDGTYQAIQGDLVRARERLTEIVAAARVAAAPSALTYPLASLASVEFDAGHWQIALADASEALQWGRETGQSTLVGNALCVLARVEAGRGQRDSCVEHATEALALADQLGIDAAVFFAEAALAFLELGEGKPEDAVAHGERVARLSEERGVREPAVVKWAPDLIEAYARTGRSGEATDLLERFSGDAERTGRTWAIATALRCRGILADASSFEDVLADALAAHDRLPMPFERARTELVLGERRRRAGRRAEARGPLRTAQRTFDRLGARGWWARAASELRATGERARRRTTSVPEQLTAQELQVALAVGRGLTNREVAAELFISPKTVDFHLGHVYRKLGLHSRVELARLVARERDVLRAPS